MKARELNDFGGFDPKPGDRAWKFWPRGTTAAAGVAVIRSAPTWIEARELAARHFAELGILVSAQDLESAPT